MDKNSILETIKVLQTEIEEKQSAIKVLKELLDKQSSIAQDNRQDDNTTKSSNISEDKEKPTNGRTDQQIIYLFDNIIQKGIRMSEILALHKQGFPEQSGVVANIIRRLYKDSHIVAVKYNGQNKLMFYGKKEWVDKKDFKKEYKPDDKFLPLVVNESEVV